MIRVNLQLTAKDGRITLKSSGHPDKKFNETEKAIVTQIMFLIRGYMAELESTKKSNERAAELTTEIASGANGNGHGPKA